MKKKNKKLHDYYQASDRIIGKIEGVNKSPTIIVLVGIHGNEKAGVEASKRVLHKIIEQHIPFEGNLYVLLGNMDALNKSIRFKDVDLNRIWNKENIDAIKGDRIVLNKEVKEQIEIYQIVKNILKNEHGPFYFLDLHTTSSPSVPFITISDSLNNRKFCSNFPIPIVLGIEEYLDGPFLSFINEYGHIALGFEGGEHYDDSSIVNCEAFIWESLVYSNCVKRNNVAAYDTYRQQLLKLNCKHEFYEINYRYALNNGEIFKMDLGFKNFEAIYKDQRLAKSNGKTIKSSENGWIFMPLYQELGDDGFFILNKISTFWLQTSKLFRKLNLNHVLRIIPGVNKDPENNYTLIVNPKIAKYMAKEIFHLFGYRKQIIKDDKYHFIKRDRKITEFE